MDSTPHSFDGSRDQYQETDPLNTDRVKENDYEQPYGQLEEDDDEEEKELKPKSHMGKVVAIVALAALLAGSLGVNYYLFDDNSTLTAAQTDQALEKQRMDTLLAAKTAVETQLAESQTLLASAQSDNEDLNRLREEGEAKINKQQNTINKLWRSKASVNAYQAPLAEAKALNESLRTQIAALTQELGLLKTENASLKDSLAALQVNQKSLNDRIIAASDLQAHTIKLESMRRRKKEKYEFTDRAKHTNRLAVSFELAQNQLAAAGIHNLHVVVYSPEGEILGENASRFTIQPEGKESAFTRNKEVNYPAEGGKIFFNWDETEKYDEGTYRVEVYCDGKLTGQSQIALR